MIKQKLRKVMAYTLLIAVVSSLFVISGCSDDEKSSKFQPIDEEGTLLALISRDEFKQAEGAPKERALDSLRKYLELYDLDVVVSSTANITVFAPSNQAFVNLLTTTPGFPQDIRTISANTIKGVLAYHVVPQVVLEADMDSGDEFPTLFTQPNNCSPATPGVNQVIEVNADGTLLTGSTNSNIEISLADNTGSNGALHIVQSVMIPPSVGSVLTPILPTVAATALLSSNFEILAGLITYADCGIVDATPKLTSILGNPAGSYTVFFPPDAVFVGGSMTNGDGTNDVTEVLTFLATNTTINTPAEVRTLILNHIHSGAEINGAGLATKTSLVMMSTVTYDINTGATTIGGKPIVQKDADTRDNGIAHAIGGILGL